jgi:hypothetical protein
MLIRFWKSDMRTAIELEAAYAREPVRLADGDATGSGVLSLAGRNSALTFSSAKRLANGDPMTGWFDVTVETNRGEKILLHNAITRRSSMPHRREREWEYTIFPNIVLLRADALLPSGRVREIQFTADGLEDIFFFDIVEWQSLYKAPPEVLKHIRATRKTNRPYPRSYEFFSPSNIYLLHSLPRVLRERLGDRTYEIVLGHRENYNRNALTIQAVAFASIKFDVAVSIDDALDSAWAWRRFFQQIAMRPLPFTTLSCRASTKWSAPSSDIYLSNMETTNRQEGPEMFSFGPADVPLGEWKNRKAFAAVMRQWLERDDTRRLFRVRLDRVLEAMRKETSTKLVADLCSAIESLTELRAPSTLSDEDLTVIVNAATAAGKSATPPVMRERLEGILGLLQHQSLPQRMKLLAAAIEAEIPKKDAKAVLKIARDLRTFEAHGDHWNEMTVPLVAPTLEMLASMCVLWDLTTCGMPSAAGDRELSALSRARWHAMELTRRRSQQSDWK